jgi:hypothetical protein
MSSLQSICKSYNHRTAFLFKYTRIYFKAANTQNLKQSISILQFLNLSQTSALDKLNSESYRLLLGTFLGEYLVQINGFLDLLNHWMESREMVKTQNPILNWRI